MEKRTGHLTLGEREVLYSMHRDGESNAEIARKLSCHRKTIGAELKRNRAPRHLRGKETLRERARAAQEMAEKRRTEWKRGRRGPLKLPAIQKQLEKELEVNKRSPEEIAALLSQGDSGIRISGKTIRRWILKDARWLQQHLPFRGKKRRNHLSPKKGRKKREALPPKKSIHTRPAPATERLEFGHKEFDFLTCSQSKTVILVGVDRKGRHSWLRKLPNREAETVRRALCGIEANLCPPLRQTLTFDNDPGFQLVFELERTLGVSCHFCDPHAAWQKGSVENVNQRIRRFIPKGTDLSLITEEELQRIEHILNSRPMDCLNGLSPAEAWALAVRDAKKLLH